MHLNPRIHCRRNDNSRSLQTPGARLRDNRVLTVKNRGESRHRGTDRKIGTIDPLA